MSIAEFSKGIRDHALKSFRTANIGVKKEINPLFYSGVTKGSTRTHEQANVRTNFIIGKGTIENIYNILKEDYPELPNVNELFNRATKIQNGYVNNIPEVRTVTTLNGNSDTVVVFNQVEFGDGIDSIIKEIFNTGNEYKNTTIRNTLVGKESAAIFQKGHVVGVTTNLLAQSAEKGMIPDYQTDKNTGTALKAINLMIEDLRKFDFESSNYGAESSYNMIGNYTKSAHQYVVELQVKKANTSSGNKVGRDVENLRNILTKDADNIAEKIFIDIREDSLFRESLAYMKGSPSMIQLIEASILEALDPKKHPSTQKQYNASGIDIAKFTKKVNVNKDKLRESLQKEIARLEQTKAKLIRDAKNKVRNTKGQFFSLTNLQMLLRARLSAQIKDNMGSGDRRDILNLRTGRFAESVQIERVTLQRDNAIAVFYSYMKRPYSTFEPDGRQGSPNTRDPVVLINKSIREIASALVTNKLRMFRQ